MNAEKCEIVPVSSSGYYFYHLLFALKISAFCPHGVLEKFSMIDRIHSDCVPKEQ